MNALPRKGVVIPPAAEKMPAAPRAGKFFERDASKSQREHPANCYHKDRYLRSDKLVQRDANGKDARYIAKQQAYENALAQLACAPGRFRCETSPKHGESQKKAACQSHFGLIERSGRALASPTGSKCCAYSPRLMSRHQCVRAPAQRNTGADFLARLRTSRRRLSRHVERWLRQSRTGY